MSNHKNYNKYYNKTNNVNQPKVENNPVAEETVTVTVSSDVDETVTVTMPNVTGEPVATAGYVEVTPVVVDLSKTEPAQIVDADTVPDLPPETTGVVVGCYKLNVRQEPDAEAPVVVTINVGATVEIFPLMETKDFYSVCTETGAMGYCMKKFIKVNSK